MTLCQFSHSVRLRSPWLDGWVFIPLGVVSYPFSIPTPTIAYKGGSWGWFAEPAWPRLGDSLLLSLAKVRMGFWVQMAEWVMSSREDLLGQVQGCRDGDARGWLGRGLPALLVLLPGGCHLPRGLREDQITKSPVSRGLHHSICPTFDKDSLTLGMHSGPGPGMLLLGFPCWTRTRAGPVESSAKNANLRRVLKFPPHCTEKVS